MSRRFLAFLAFYGAFQLVCGSNSLDFSLHSYGTLRSEDIRHQIIPNRASPRPYDHVRRLETSFGDRHFVLELVPRLELFASNFKVFSVDGVGRKKRHYIDAHRFYRGQVQGEAKSEAIVHVDDEGVVTATIHLENETYHIEPAVRHFTEPQSFHMITYRGSDVKSNLSGGSFCDMGDAEHQNFVDLHLNIEDEGEDTGARLRRKRDVEKNSCPIALVADYRFFAAFGRNNQEAATAQYLINIFSEVEKRFRQTDWGGGYTGLGFVLQEVTVHTRPSSSTQGLREAPYNKGTTKAWDSRNFLSAIIESQQSWDEFCLVHVFTYQDFSGGLLGLAPIASSVQNKLGGICSSPYIRFQKLHHTNVGYSTGINWDRKLLIMEQQIVLQHELGHNWGSPHDPQSCQNGKFIMSASAVSGGDPNNFKFSTCSRASALGVLRSKSSCFTAKETSFCGNKYREPGEECDGGGLGSSEAGDQCCDENCRYRNGAVCSDENDECCRNCSFADSSMVCYEASLADSMCKATTYCNGSSAECPTLQSKPDDSPCLNEGKCRDGACVPFCTTKKLSPCVCPDKECAVCCESENRECAPFGELIGKLSESRNYSDNTSCSQGICESGICVENVQDTVPRFWDSVENLSFNTIVRWIRDNIVGSVLLFTTILWIPASCLVHHFDKKRKNKIFEQEEDYQNAARQNDEDEADYPDKFLPYDHPQGNRGENYKVWWRSNRRGLSHENVQLLSYK